MRNLRELARVLPGHSVLVVGDLMLDEYVWGQVRRISPEAPVPIVEVCGRSYAAGGAANTAANVVSLGGRALLGGIVGQDWAANRLCQVLAQTGVDSSGLVVDGQRPTTTKSRVIAHNQQVVRMDTEQNCSILAALEETLLQWVEYSLERVDACILSDYDKGVVTPTLAERFIGLARQAGKPVVVDPKGINYTKYRGATIITPNVPEAERASNSALGNEVDLAEIGHRLSMILAGGALLITQGAQGMSLFYDGNLKVHIPAVARNVFDVTGAGDTVVSTLALALAVGAPLEQAAELANHAAGIVVGKFGAAMVTVDELLAQMES